MLRRTSDLYHHFVGLLCRKQKDLSLSRPSSREDGSIAKVIRSQFLYPTAHPDSFFQTYYISNSQIKWRYQSWMKKISCTKQMQWSVFYRTILSHHVCGRRIPGRRTTNSSFASRQQKSMSSLMSWRQVRSSFTCCKSRVFHIWLENGCLSKWNSICSDSQTITNMEPSGLLGQVMALMPFSFSQHISDVSLRILTVLSKNSSFVFSRRFGIAPW